MPSQFDRMDLEPFAYIEDFSVGNLKSEKAIYFKAFLFLVSGTLAAATLIVQNPSLENAFLLAITIWSFCRLYYFIFYVIEKYVDSKYRFSGIIPFLMYVFKKAEPDAGQADK